jgi:hypothetical protein
MYIQFESESNHASFGQTMAASRSPPPFYF